MTEHSTAELKRQYQQAMQRETEARRAAWLAREAYQARLCFERLAQLAALGIVPGGKAIFVPKWDGEREVVGFIGVHASFGDNVETDLSRLKKDGTPSASKKHFGTGTLEPWEGSPEQAKELGK